MFQDLLKKIVFVMAVVVVPGCKFAVTALLIVGMVAAGVGSEAF